MFTLKVEAENSIRFKVSKEESNERVEVLEEFNILVLKDKITIKDFSDITCINTKSYKNRGYTLTIQLTDKGKIKLHEIYKNKNIKSVLFVFDGVYFEVPITEKIADWVNAINFKTNLASKDLIALENKLNKIMYQNAKGKNQKK
jgi:hypothetical protein